MEVDVSLDEDIDENILYDLSIHAEWPLETEILNKNVKEKSRGSIFARTASATKRTVCTTLRTLGFPLKSSSPCTLPVALVRLVSSQLNWHLAVTADGGFVAVVQEQLVEIRSSLDEFSSVIGRGNVGRDAYPQWRNLSWSPDGSLLACSSSNGQITVFDMIGTLIAYIPSESVAAGPSVLPLDLSDAVASLLFTTDTTKDGSSELLAINYHGYLRSYKVNTDSGFLKKHTFPFSSYYPQGISDALYHCEHRLLIIGGHGIKGSQHKGVTTLSAEDEGITMWRILTDYPYYKMVTDYETDLRQSRHGPSFMSRITAFNSFWHQEQNGILRFSLSPNGKVLVSLHHCGKICTWDMPSLRKRCSWENVDQPGYDLLSPAFTEDPGKFKYIKDLITSQSLCDAAWWSDEAMILARNSGAVTISSVDTLNNLLGGSPEWFEPAPRLSQANDGGFLVLECEYQFVGQKPKMALLPDLSAGSKLSDGNEYDDSDDEDASIFKKTTSYTRNVLYYITDIERFQPPRKRPRLVQKIYRLVCLRSTTPQELYARKIDLEEYGEALALAKAYGLDCDLVYQRQWRKATVSIATIQDYLSRIQKRAWVLHECVERVPEDMDPMRELLEFGLRGTDLHALIAIGKGTDKGRFMLNDETEVDEDDDEDSDYDPFDEESCLRREEKQNTRRENKLDQVDFTCLTLEQKELIRVRQRLLQYQDRLYTYEYILGGKRVAADMFDCRFYKKFRSQNIIEAAIEYARDGDTSSVEALITYHSREILPHWLAILSNFPETIWPEDYRQLLPWMMEDGEGVEGWQVDEWREADWCETEQCRTLVDPCPMDLGAFIYEESPELEQFCTMNLTSDLLYEWFTLRAHQIDGLSCHVDHACDLIRMAIDRRIGGNQPERLDHFHADLMTMETVVYECNIDSKLSLADFQKLSDLKKLKLLLSTSSHEMYIKNVRRWLVPFLERCEERNTGSYDSLLQDYAVSLATTDLTLPALIFKTSKPGVAHPVIHTDTEMMSVALDVIYTSDRSDQLKLASGIVECLPQRYNRDLSMKGLRDTRRTLVFLKLNLGSELIPRLITLLDASFFLSENGGHKDGASVRLHKQVDELERQLSAAQILEKHGLALPIKNIKTLQSEPDDTENLIIKMTRMAGKRMPPLRKAEWWELLTDVQQLQQLVFRCISPQLGLQIFVEGLLCSSRLDSIRLAGELIEISASDRLHPTPSVVGGEKLPYDTALLLVLQAAREYFDSSAHLIDSCMDLARACLNLIRDTPTEVLDELDLIASLSLLDDFGISVLPLQVRLSKTHLNFVRQAIDQRPFSYKQSQKLLRLGHLLRVPGETQIDRDGQVLHLVADAAIKENDYSFAFEVCRDLMNENYDAVWTSCRDLAEQTDFQNIHAKAELLSFALTYCDTELIQPILKARVLLETKILYDTVTSNLEDTVDGNDSSRTRQSSSPFSASAALQQTQDLITRTTRTTRDLLSSTSKATKIVLSTMTDTRWWQTTIRHLKQPSAQPLTSHVNSRDDHNAHMDRLGCHPFYADLVPDCYVDMDTLKFDKRSVASSETSLSQKLLRTSQLQNLLTEGEGEASPISEVLLSLSHTSMPVNSTLGLAYLMALPQLSDAEQLFADLPNTSIILELASYYYAIQIYAMINRSSDRKQARLYQHAPHIVIQTVMDHVTQQEGADWTQELEGLVKKLQYYRDLLDNFTQATLLQGLGKGVDVVRFTDDEQYKQETILGLAMSLEESMFNTGVSLADRYDVSLWEFYITHLEFLFTDSGLSTKEIDDHLKSLNILPSLSGNRSEFSTRMKKYVYPCIDGTDLGRLILLYTVLERCAGGSDNWFGLSVSEHVQVLKKIRPHTSVLDYKQLMEEKDSICELFKDVLRSDNIHAFATLADKFPNPNGGRLHSSDIYCCWAVKFFWQVDKKKVDSKEGQAEGSIWVHRWEACGETIMKLLPVHLLKLVTETVFSKQGREQLPLEARQVIVKRALKFCRQSGGGKKKKLSDAGCEVSWEQAGSDLQRSQNHLETLTSDLIRSMELAEDERFHRYSELYDVSQGDSAQLKNLVVSMVYDGQSIDLIDDFLSSIHLENWTPRTATQEALNRICTELRAANDEHASSLMDSLNTLLVSIQEHKHSGGTLVDADDVINFLRPLCADEAVIIQTRLQILNILEQSFSMSSEDSQLLLVCRTNAVMHASWPDKQITESDIVSTASRHSLFTDLLSSSVSLSHLISLADLLRIWPTFDSETYSVPSANPWSQLIIAMLKTGDAGAIESILTVMKTSGQVVALNEQSVLHVFDEMVSGGHTLAAVKLVLLSEYHTLYSKAVTQITTLTPSESDDHSELLVLILKRRLVPEIVSTSWYLKVTEFLLTRDTTQESKADREEYLLVETVARQLNECGYSSEAGWLLLQSRSVHPLLRSFHAARSAVAHWFS